MADKGALARRDVLRAAYYKPLETDDAADAAILGRLQTEQCDEIRRQVERIVVVNPVAIRLGRADTATGCRFPAGIVHVVDHRAVPLLGDGTARHGHQEPIDFCRDIAAESVHVEPVDNRKTGSIIDRLSHAFHHRLTGGHIEITRHQSFGRQVVAQQLRTAAISA